ncbi:MAG TPA: dipeptidase [Candidatus Latescibacteria bacterium]|jgi:membrane dipeptidase|nr:dipeptidase [Candidatus Latescibacterota bacterium]HJP32316.1 dipeptidase [Candidatus Latescibacterota bacterium]
MTAATDLHRDSLVIDSHNDTAVALIRRGNVGIAGEDGADRHGRAGAVAYLRQYLSPRGQEPVQFTLPRLRQGAVDAAFFAVDTTRAWGNHLVYAIDAIGYLKREIESHADDMLLARSVDDIATAKAAGKVAVLLAVENTAALQHSLYAIDALYELGVRTMTLTHSARTEAADGCEVEGGGGLTGFGRDVVRRMNELGLLVDVSHLNERGFWDTLEHSTAPVVASHSCCWALCDHRRNLTDEQLRALGDAGGVVGITFVPFFVDTSAPSLDRLVEHFEHALEVAGGTSVGLGSDFDGGGDLLAHGGELPRITEALLARGLAEDVVRGILGANHLRLLRQTIG